MLQAVLETLLSVVVVTRRNYIQITDGHDPNIIERAENTLVHPIQGRGENEYQAGANG